jgi:hypothetical protein
VQSKRAQVAALQGLQARLLGELRARQEAEEALQAQWGRITEYMAEYQRQAAVMCALSEDSVALSGALAAQAAEARATLGHSLAPRCRLVVAAARRSAGSAAHEAAAARGLPAAAALAPGAPGGQLSAPTLARLRHAAQHLCRAGAPPSAAAPSKAGPAGGAAGPRGGGGSGGVADPVMAAALEAACDLDELAPLKCPAEIMAGAMGGWGGRRGAAAWSQPHNGAKPGRGRVQPRLRRAGCAHHRPLPHPLRWARPQTHPAACGTRRASCPRCSSS